MHPCVVIPLVILSVTGISCQNYLTSAHISAMQIKGYYDSEVQQYRKYLTTENEDSAYFFTNLVTNTMSAAKTAKQGAGIASCALMAAYESDYNVAFMNSYIVDADRAANALHNSVLNQLTWNNIKSEGGKAFFEQHTMQMAVAYAQLYTHYSNNMFYAWMLIYLDFYYVYDKLDYCLFDVMHG